MDCGAFTTLSIVQHVPNHKHQHVIRDYYRFVDQNVKDNAKQEPWSCH